MNYFNRAFIRVKGIFKGSSMILVVIWFLLRTLSLALEEHTFRGRVHFSGLLCDPGGNLALLHHEAKETVSSRTRLTTFSPFGSR